MSGMGCARYNLLHTEQNDRSSVVKCYSMIKVNSFVECLELTGVDFFTGVPDSLLKSFCAYVTDNCGDNHVIAANEGGAIGLAVGHYLATGKPALVYM